VLAQLTFRENEESLRDLDLAAKFRFIYRTNMWGSAETPSGVGSTLEATGPIRQAITNICRDFGIGTLTDAPCGDCSWIVPNELLVERYIGADIVPELIEQDRQRYQKRGVEFTVADLTSDVLPRADLIFCRDCLVHLSFENIQRVLLNFRKSGSRYLLTTTFPEHEDNLDIADGDWRLLNLERPLFSFPPALFTINEECDEIGGAYRDKSLALWEIDSLPL
jgi:hypothetical protein